MKYEAYWTYWHINESGTIQAYTHSHSTGSTDKLYSVVLCLYG